MKTKGLTLAEALATGLPFKQRQWTSYVDKTNKSTEPTSIIDSDFFEPVWEVPNFEINTINNLVKKHGVPLKITRKQWGNKFIEVLCLGRSVIFARDENGKEQLYDIYGDDFYVYGITGGESLK